MSLSPSPLDRPAARLVAGGVALAVLGLAGWLLYLDNREDPAVAACVKQHEATIERARDKGALAADVAAQFLARIEASCRADAGRPGD